MVVLIAILSLSANPAWAQGRARPWRLFGAPTATQPTARANGGVSSTAPTTQPATTQPSPRTRYTAPGEAFRTGNPLATAALLQVGVAAQAVTGGRELSEARVTARPLAASPGMPGLTPSNPTIQNATVTMPGILTGSPGGLGYASRTNTIFNARPNPATGPGGVCNTITAGGFQGKPTFCGLQRR